MSLDRRTMLGSMAAAALVGAGESLPQVVARIRRSVVGIALFLPFKGGSPQLTGSGFVVGDGRHIVTCAHVIRQSDPKQTQILYALIENGSSVDRRQASIVAVEPAFDLALLRVDGPPLPAVSLRKEPDLLPEGSDIATTGFPIGSVLGFFPVTHRGIVSARTSNISPLPDSRFIQPEMLRAPRFQIYQLDLVAYPGQSGSCFYEAATGIVCGVINSTYLRSTKEKVLSDPSAITYAIPSGLVRQVMQGAKVVEAG